MICTLTRAHPRPCSAWPLAIRAGLVTCRSKAAAAANLRQQEVAKPSAAIASYKDDVDPLEAFDISTAAAEEVSDDSMNVASLGEGDDASF